MACVSYYVLILSLLR